MRRRPPSPPRPSPTTPAAKTSSHGRRPCTAPSRRRLPRPPRTKPSRRPPKVSSNRPRLMDSQVAPPPHRKPRPPPPSPSRRPPKFSSCRRRHSPVALPPHGQPSPPRTAPLRRPPKLSSNRRRLMDSPVLPPAHGQPRPTTTSPSGRLVESPVAPPPPTSLSHHPPKLSSKRRRRPVPPPTHGQPRPPTTALSRRPPMVPVAPPPHRQPRPPTTAATSSLDLFPPLPPHPQLASWTLHEEPRNAARRQTFHHRIYVEPHGLLDTSPASKASSQQHPDWVMLDPHIRLTYHPNESFLCTHAMTETSMGQHIHVSFRTVTPPGASRLYVSSTLLGGTKGESSSGAGRGEDCWDQFNAREAIVVAAHDNSILLQLTFENTQSDFFVYMLPTAGPPSLMLLPRCNHKFTDAIHCSGGLDHMSRIKEIGLLCNTDKEMFVVVDLIILPSAYKADDAPVVSQLCVLHGSCSKDGWTTTPWRAIRPQIHHAKVQGKELIWWDADAVIPFRDSLCYVDYFRGIFFVDLLSGNPKLQYVRLPVTIPDGDPVDLETGLRGCPELYRSVCVTNDGSLLKFVEVVTTTVFISGIRAPASSSFSMNVWKLAQDTMTWEKEYVMYDTELWALQGCGDLLRVAPSFPLVSMEEPDVVYFVLINRCFNDAGTSCVIAVDMLKRTMRSLSRYNMVYPNCIGSDDDMASANLTTNSAFIPCAFSKYLHMRA